jgi:LPS-assembly lipoprotein
LSRLAHRARAFAGVAVAALLATSCGFQLRGDPAIGISSLQLSSNVPSGTATEIRRALASSSPRKAAPADPSATQLRILSEGRDKQVYTITSTGRVYEFQLRLVVRYEVLIPGREAALIAPTEVEARRIITYSETAPIAKEAEEQLLFRDMQLELAGRILRQIALAQRDI